MTEESIKILAHNITERMITNGFLSEEDDEDITIVFNWVKQEIEERLASQEIENLPLYSKEGKSTTEELEEAKIAYCGGKSYQFDELQRNWSEVYLSPDPEDTAVYADDERAVELFPRRCDDTGRGFYEGYCFGDGEAYSVDEEETLKECKLAGYNTIEEAVEDDYCYWSEWYDEDLKEQGYAYDAEGNEYQLDKEGNWYKV